MQAKGEKKNLSQKAFSSYQWRQTSYFSEFLIAITYGNVSQTTTPAYGWVREKKEKKREKRNRQNLDVVGSKHTTTDSWNITNTQAFL
jgi:hypothetical protein